MEVKERRESVVVDSRFHSMEQLTLTESIDWCMYESDNRFHSQETLKKEEKERGSREETGEDKMGILLNLFFLSLFFLS